MLQVLEDFLTDDVQYNWVQMLTYAMRMLTYAAGAGGLPNGRRAVQLGADVPRSRAAAPCLRLKGAGQHEDRTLSAKLP
jgi:hypothetical protein